MKTKEEIKELAKKKFNGTYYPYSRQGYIDGYTQCQEDMAKDVEYWQSESDHWYQQAIDMADKKYTEEDIVKALFKGFDYCLDNMTKDSSEITQDNVQDFISSLNKQD